MTAHSTKFDLTTIGQNIAQTINPRASQLQQMVQSKLTNERLAVVVDKLLEKADKGDTKALDYLLKMGGMQPSGTTTVIVQQFAGPEPEVPRQVANKVELSILQKVTAFLGVAVEATPAQIADQGGMEAGQVIRCLDDHPELFAVEGDRYSLIQTRKGKR